MVNTKSNPNIHQNDKFSRGACPRTPLAKRRATHPASGIYISPQYYPPPPCLNMDLRP